MPHEASKLTLYSISPANIYYPACVCVCVRVMVTVRYTFHFRLCAYFSIFQILLSSFVTVNTISHFVYLSLFICSSPIPLKGELVAFHLVCAYSKWFQTFSKCDSQTIRVPIYWWTCVGLSSRSSSSKHHIGGITSNGNNTTATKVWRYARIPVMNHLMTMKSYLFIYFQQQQQQQRIDWFFANSNRSISWYSDFAEDDCKKHLLCARYNGAMLWKYNWSHHPVARIAGKAL